MNIEIDVEQFARDIKSGKSIGGKDGALGSLIKQLTEAALSAEIDSHLTQDFNKNHKNGYATKTMKGEYGEFELDVPRDRNGSFCKPPQKLHYLKQNSFDKINQEHLCEKVS